MVDRARIALSDAFQMGKNAIAPFVPGILRDAEPGLDRYQVAAF